VHNDLVVPTRIKGLKGEQCFILLVDDYTRMIAVCFLRNKSMEFKKFKMYKCLTSDNGGEFTSKEFMDF
jgi:hypothetical protein